MPSMHEMDAAQRAYDESKTRNPFLDGIEASDDTRKWLRANVKEWDRRIMDKCAETGKHPSEIAMDIGRGMAEERRHFKLVIVDKGE